MTTAALPIPTNLRDYILKYENVNLNNTVPAPPGGSSNVTWRADEFGNISASVAGGGGGGTPSAPASSVQFNNSGSFGGDANFTWNNTKKIFNQGPAWSALTPYAQALVPDVNDPAFTFPYGANFNTIGTNGAAILSVMEGTTDGTSAGEAGNVFAIGHYPIDSTFGTGGWNTQTYNTGSGNIHGSSYAQSSYMEYDGTGTLAEQIGIWATSNFNGGNGGTVTLNEGIRIGAQQGVGTTNVALAIDDQGTGTNDYAIKVVGGQNDLGPQQTKIGVTVPSIIYSAAGTPLPVATTALTGARAVVSDAISPIFLGAYSSGGTALSPVMCTGTGWVTA